MNSTGHRGLFRAVLLAALLGAGLAVAAGRARADAPQPGPSAALQSLEDQVTLVERVYGRKDETEAARALRKFSDGEVQFILRDWRRASILLYDAVDQHDFKRTEAHETALFYLGESLYQQAEYASAFTYFKQALEEPNPVHQRDAVVRALDIAIRLRDESAVGPLVDKARIAFGGALPPEVLYLQAKALYRRSGVPAAERDADALRAFAAVPAPYDLAAAYFQGAILVQAGDLKGGAERFEACTRLAPSDARRQEVRELCFLALGRIYSEQSRFPEALDRYQEVPRESPHFNDAIYEVAWDFVKTKKYEQALRTAAVITDLAPESPLAPEATILQGHLLLRLGRYSEALETYGRVINQYAPVRDELDAILTMHEDPVRYFNELIGRSGKAFDITTVLPAVAVKWASSQADVAAALQVVAGLDGSRRDAEESEELAKRILAVLSKNDGLDAFPALKEGFARADAVQNGAARVEGELNAGERALIPAPPEAQAELARIAQDRNRLEARFSALPTSPDEVAERVGRMSGRVSEVARHAFHVRYLIDSCNSAIAASQIWLEEHRTEIQSDPKGRAEFLEEMRKHREVVAQYDQELRTVEREIASTGDGVSGSEAIAGESELRREYRRLLARERELLAPGRAGLEGDARREVERLDAYLPRADEVALRAERSKLGLLAAALQSSQALRGRVMVEQQLLRLYQKDLGAVQDATRDLVGRVALRSFRNVRAQFYKLVLKADVGMVDVAWTRKRERVDKIQELASQKASDVGTLDSEFKPVLREVDE